jgi:Uma2 family endonuclease
MAAQTLVSPEEYLATHYEHDTEWVDGEVIERPVPTMDHGWTQRQLGILTPSQHLGAPAWGAVELRVKIGSRYRVIDYCAYVGEWPGNRPTKPPLVAVEILSEDESMSRLLDKLEEYRTWGVRHVWLVDPGHRKLYLYDGDLRATTALSAPEVGLEVRPDNIFLPA